MQVRRSYRGLGSYPLCSGEYLENSVYNIFCKMHWLPVFIRDIRSSGEIIWLVPTKYKKCPHVYVIRPLIRALGRCCARKFISRYPLRSFLVILADVVLWIVGKDYWGDDIVPRRRVPTQSVLQQLSSSIWCNHFVFCTLKGSFSAGSRRLLLQVNAYYVWFSRSTECSA